MLDTWSKPFSDTHERLALVGERLEGCREAFVSLAGDAHLRDAPVVLPADTLNEPGILGTVEQLGHGSLSEADRSDDLPDVQVPPWTARSLDREEKQVLPRSEAAPSCDGVAHRMELPQRKPEGGHLPDLFRVELARVSVHATCFVPRDVYG